MFLTIGDDKIRVLYISIVVVIVLKISLYSNIDDRKVSINKY